mmetsp:Transcript_58274/g.103475  ORF Transcript_58274/g.103475 Transcript_58274/m.103475 type:complete len:92 (+) Transcript_58274:3586-3861(+)
MVHKEVAAGDPGEPPPIIPGLAIARRVPNALGTKIGKQYLAFAEGTPTVCIVFGFCLVAPCNAVAALVRASVGNEDMYAFRYLPSWLLSPS